MLVKIAFVLFFCLRSVTLQNFLYRVDSSDYSLVELLFSNLVYLRYVAFCECNAKPSKWALGVVKKEKENKVIGEVYDGHERYNQIALNL